MLREFRRSDAGTFFNLLQRHFPEEQALVGFRPDAFEKVVRRIFRPDVRLLLWLLDLLRHPIVKAFVVEADGRIAATAILTFSRQAGFVSTVMVDTPYRRRGYAKDVLRACVHATRHAGRPYVVLDVLTTNAPALALYRAEGYVALRSNANWVLELGPSTGSPAIGPPDGIRPMRRRDAAKLQKIASTGVPEEVERVLPMDRKAFFVPPLVVTGLDSETAAWVVDRGAGAEGFLRATVSEATESGHLTQPILAPSVPPDLGGRLLATAVDWLRSKGIRRVVAEVPRHNVAGLRVLEAGGFHEAFALDTLVRSSAS